jgi:hypothetical protein
VAANVPLIEPSVHANTTASVLVPLPDFVPLTGAFGHGEITPQGILRIPGVDVVAADTIGSGRVRPLNKNTVGVDAVVDPPGANV